MYKVISPLVEAHQKGNDFEIAKIIKKHSPLLDRKTFAAGLDDQTELIQKAEIAVDSLMSLWKADSIFEH